jgi:hypothetical protein
LLVPEDKSGLNEGFAVIGKSADGETCEGSEGVVEKCNEWPRKESAVAVCGEVEFRHQPGRAGPHVRSKPRGERFDFIGEQAVEEEVGYDQVIVWRGRLKCADVRDLDLDAVAVGAGPARELGQHGRTGVDSVDEDCGIVCEQACSEPAVAIAQDESPAMVREAVKKRTSAPRE